MSAQQVLAWILGTGLVGFSPLGYADEAALRQTGDHDALPIRAAGLAGG
jgi:hypothetical protein